MTGEHLKTYEREGWVIPNGCGALWTDRVFDTEADAQAHIDQYWREAKWTLPKHRPALARVQLIATLVVTTPTQPGGGDA